MGDECKENVYALACWITLPPRCFLFCASILIRFLKKALSDYSGCCCLCCYSPKGGATRCKWCAVVGLVLTAGLLTAILALTWIDINSLALRIFLTLVSFPFPVYVMTLWGQDLCLYFSAVPFFFFLLY